MGTPVEYQCVVEAKKIVWRLCKETVPTSDMLRHRHMSSTPACSFCLAEDSWKHALINCTTARCFWSLSFEDTVELMCENLNFNAKAWVFTMHEKLSQEEFARMIVTLWAIWKSRRKAIHEGIYESPMQIHNR